MSNSEREKLIAVKEEHGDKVLWKCWKLFLIRSAGLDGLARPVAVFLQEFGQYLPMAEKAVMERRVGQRTPPATAAPRDFEFRASPVAHHDGVVGVSRAVVT